MGSFQYHPKQSPGQLGAPLAGRGFVGLLGTFEDKEILPLRERKRKLFLLRTRSLQHVGDVVPKVLQRLIRQTLSNKNLKPDVRRYLKGSFYA